MRVAVFADVHGNYEALDAVLKAITYDSPDLSICLGDMVGYGPDPARCIERMRSEGIQCLAGNHDHGVLGYIDETIFNYFAREALLWTREQLNTSQMDYLRSLGLVAHFSMFATAHGSLHGAELFNYIQTLFDAEMSFEALDKAAFFYGHTHIPMVFFDTTPMTYTMEGDVEIEPGMRVLVNVGSVGQPRDEDPRAAYCIYDVDKHKVTFRRVPYEVHVTSEKIIRAGLPEALALRLEMGK